MRSEKRKTAWRTVLGAALSFLCMAAVCSRDGTQAADLAHLRELPAVQTASAGRMVVPLGRAVGIKLFSDGVLVVGMSELETGQGMVSPGKACGLKTGDVITHVNGKEVDTIEEVQDILKEEGKQPLTLRASRGGKVVQLSAQAVANRGGQYQLGVWLRDSMAGIGTLTFYDPASGQFGALGHGINDIDTAKLMPLESGTIMYASVSDVKKGAPGVPGELHGTFDVSQDLGTLHINTELGVYGTLTQTDAFPTGTLMKTARRDEIFEGPATILSNVAGEEVREYAIEITQIYPAAAGAGRNFMVRVTDPELLNQTGGIVQGMSGSPVIQNGKLVGAVTHVLVNDPTRGYGIFIENMLEASENS